MSLKRQVTTFRITLVHTDTMLEGPVVSPDRRRLAENFEMVHRFCSEDQGMLVYDKQWVYLPATSILAVRKGSSLFSLPWPLRDDTTAESPDAPEHPVG